MGDYKPKLLRESKGLKAKNSDVFLKRICDNDGALIKR